MVIMKIESDLQVVASRAIKYTSMWNSLFWKDKVRLPHRNSMFNYGYKYYERLKSGISFDVLADFLFLFFFVGASLFLSFALGVFFLLRLEQ